MAGTQGVGTHRPGVRGAGEMRRDEATTIGLLVPVPSVHIVAARDEAMTSIALGTRATDILEEFAPLGADGAPVFVYTSHESGQPRLVVSWSGTFCGYREAVGNGAVPRNWRRHRPTTMRDEDRTAGWWTGYYLVGDIRPVDEPWPISGMRAYAGDEPLAPNFVPLGPIVVVR
jgi:hypothetical protein